MKREVRILQKAPIFNDPRVTFVRRDRDFTIVEVDLEPGESYCWRCAFIALDPDAKLETCPNCGLDFND